VPSPASAGAQLLTVPAAGAAGIPFSRETFPELAAIPEEKQEEAFKIALAHARLAEPHANQSATIGMIRKTLQFMKLL
jgi:hypothetical protein